MTAPRSLTPMSRFTTLIVRSPSCPPIPTIKPVSATSRAEKAGNENHIAYASAIEKVTAPSAPSQVLLGLMLLRSGQRDEERESGGTVRLVLTAGEGTEVPPPVHWQPATNNLSS